MAARETPPWQRSDLGNPAEERDNAIGGGSFLPTDDDIAFYEAHGWWISPRVIPDELLERAARAADEFYRTGGSPLPVDADFRDWRPEDGLDVLRNNEFVSLRSPGIAELACHAVIGAMAARLARTHEIRLLDDQLVWKPPARDPDDGVVGWHADHAYWGTCSSDRLLTAWIPFDGANEQAGTLMVLDGSHRWMGTSHLRSFNDPDLDGVAGSLNADGRTVRPVAIELERGQVSFHHGWTVHGSAPNRSPRPRLALAVHLQDADNSYVPCTRPDGSPVQMADEALCRRRADGTPDFADPTVFPRIWPAA
jgi:hypothetical protein